MKSIRSVFGICAALVAAAASAQIKWAPSYQAALDRAKAENKVVMVEFYASWDLRRSGSANWSGRMEQETFADKNVIAMAGKVVPVRVAVDKEGKDLAKKFRIVNYPTVLFLDKNQNDVGTIDGYEGADEFVKHAATFLKDFSDAPKFAARYKKNPKDLGAVAGLGTIEANRYHVGPAIAKAKEAEAIDPKNATGLLSDLFSAIGDHYQNAADYEPAITWFKKTADTSRVTDKKAYALLSIATCYMSMESPLNPKVDANDPKLMDKRLEHFRKALPFVESTLKLPGLKAEDKRIAESDQKDIKDLLRMAGG